MSDPNDWNKAIIEEFRANAGVVGGPFEGAPMLILHTTGAKSGAERITPLVYQDLGDGEHIAIFGSKAGATTHPDWYHNIVANPDVTIEIGADTKGYVARVAEGDERDRIWEQQKTNMPGFAEYEIKAEGRVIPVIVLTPA